MTLLGFGIKSEVSYRVWWWSWRYKQWQMQKKHRRTEHVPAKNTISECPQNVQNAFLLMWTLEKDHSPSIRGSLVWNVRSEVTFKQHSTNVHVSWRMMCFNTVIKALCMLDESDKFDMDVFFDTGQQLSVTCRRNDRKYEFPSLKNAHERARKAMSSWRRLLKWEVGNFR